MKIISYIQFFLKIIKEEIKMTVKLMNLPYEANALEPEMDEESVKIHHDKHHQGYVNNFNKAIENYPELNDKSIEWILKNLDSIPNEIKQAVINHGGGVYNHNVFWNILGKGSEFSGEIAEAINKKFGSFDTFKEAFSKAATTLFGSGWAWLVLKDNELEIVQTKNQNSVISKGMIPLITLDVWEHSYYLKYQNKRPEYIENFFSIINWDKVNEMYKLSKK